MRIEALGSAKRRVESRLLVELVELVTSIC